MQISDYTKVYLILHRLDEADKKVFDANIKKQFYWYLQPTAILVVCTSNINPLMKEVTDGLKNPATVTFIEAGQQIYTVMRNGNGEFQTAFDRPENKPTSS